jgi:uncharacterized protein (DUF58 family)
MNTAEIHYKVPWRARGAHPGHHPSQQRGGGLRFRNHVSLINAPDPRRFDVRASLRDPFEQVQIRVYEQASAIPVYVIADLSASMGFTGACSKPQVLADFVACLSYSAYRTGDRFGFIGCGAAVSQQFYLPPTLHRAAGAELAARLADFVPTEKHSDGLLTAAGLLGARRALVFLLSDFHVPQAMLERVLASFAYHDVVPVMLWDRREYEQLPAFGIARVTDRETRRSRMLLMRPALKERIRQNFGARRDQLFRLFSDYGRAPLLMRDGFNPDEVTNYFFA